MVKEIKIYLTPDGAEFSDYDRSCLYDTLLTNVQHIVDNKDLTREDKAVRFFRLCADYFFKERRSDINEVFIETAALIERREECAYYCLAFKILSDYGSDYPGLFKAYAEIANYKDFNVPV